MAQATDYNLANQTGADFRAELNEILAASVSLNSGSSEPTTMYAHQLWVDTSSNVLKIRNAANNAWLTTGVSITASNTFDINAGTINGITSLSFSSGATVASILDEDNLSSDSATALATQQSIKAYVDSQVTAQDLDITDGSSTIAIDLDSETLSLLGGTGITSTASGNGVTFAIGQSVGTSDNVVFNQVTGALVGNASTATTLATARTISGVSFDGSANITLDTDDIGEGSNKYFTAERVDDQVNTLLTAGANISLTYDDAGGTLTIANTNSADITSVVAGDGLTGGGTSGAVTLAVGVDGSSIEINSDALRVKASGITNAMLGGSIANNKLANSSVTINSNSLSLGGTLTLDTDDIGEGSSNLYYTDARANSAIDARVTNTFINNLSGVVADTATALATARTIALSGDVVGSVSFDGTSDVTISSTIQANSVALGTDTTGNYVATITGTANKVSVSGSGSETAGVTLSLPDDVQIADSLTVAGNLTVNGDLTYLDTTNLKIEDNLFELNANLTGSPVNDSGMLINRGNQNNGVFMWDESADKFTMGLTTADGTSTGNITLASLGTLVANLEGNVTGTIQTAAQGNITSLGTLTGLTVDAGSSGMIDFGDVTSAYGRLYADSTGTYIGSKSNHNLILRSNHTAALTLDTSQNATFAGTINSGAITTTGNINLGDNDKAIFGAGSDLQIYHDGANSFIEDTDIGSLFLKTNGAGVYLYSGSEALATFNSNGANNFYYDNALKLSTTATGIQVTGTAVATNMQVSNGGKYIFGAENTRITGEVDGNGKIRLFTGGTEKVIIDGSNVGIGVSDPDADLEVRGSTVISTASDGVNSILMGLSGSNRTTIQLDTADTTHTNRQWGLTNIAGDFYIGRHGLGVMTMKNDGKVGIDCTPTEKLTVNGALAITGALVDDRTSTAAMDFSSGVTRFVSYGASGTGGIFAFRTASGGASSTEKMRLDASGNLGLGTSSPQQKLHVVGGQARFDDHISIQPTKKLYLDGGNDTYIDEVAANTIAFNSGGAERLRITSGGNVQIADSGKLVTKKTSGEVIRFERSSDDLRYSSIHANSTDGGGAFIQFKVHTGASATSTADVMTLMGSGRCGIGTSSPATPLHIESTSIPQLRVAYNGSNYQNISYEGSDIYGGSQTFKIAGSEKMRLDSSGNLGLGTSSPRVLTGQKSLTINASVPRIDFKVGDAFKHAILAEAEYLEISADPDNNQANSFIIFRVDNSESMRIDSSGSLIVGGSSVGAENSAGIDSSGIITISRASGVGRNMMLFKNGGSDVGSISSNTSSTAYNTSSDARLKDVTGEARGLEVINELNPVAYNWKADGNADEGLIAQEVMDIVPNAVSGSEEDMYQMDYSKLVVHLVAGMKEQQTQIEELKTEIQNLKGE
jgi:hypothetical protein